MICFRKARFHGNPFLRRVPCGPSSRLTSPQIGACTLYWSVSLNISLKFYTSTLLRYAFSEIIDGYICTSLCSYSSLLGRFDCYYSCWALYFIHTYQGYDKLHFTFLIGLLQQTITWYKTRHAGGQTHYYSRTGTLNQRDLNQKSVTGPCFNVSLRE